jgi:hypothetical protein
VRGGSVKFIFSIFCGHRLMSDEIDGEIRGEGIMERVFKPSRVKLNYINIILLLYKEVEKAQRQKKQEEEKGIREEEKENEYKLCGNISSI